MLTCKRNGIISKSNIFGIKTTLKIDCRTGYTKSKAVKDHMTLWQLLCQHNNAYLLASVKFILKIDCYTVHAKPKNPNTKSKAVKDHMTLWQLLRQHNNAYLLASVKFILKTINTSCFNFSVPPNVLISLLCR